MTYDLDPWVASRVKMVSIRLPDGSEATYPLSLERAIQEITISPFDFSGVIYLYDVDDYQVREAWRRLKHDHGKRIAWPGVRARPAARIIQAVKLRLGNDSIGVKVRRERGDYPGVFIVERCKGWVKGSTRKL